MFFRKTNLNFDERDDWVALRANPAYELMNEEEFLRRFRLFRDAERAFQLVDMSFKNLVEEQKVVPSSVVEELDRLRNERDRLRNPLILANMKLVFKVASVYTGRGLDFVDLVQEGAFALVRTLEKYEPEKGFKFSTYAAWWLRSMFTRSIFDTTLARIVRVPIHHQEQEAAVMREESAFETMFGRCPDDDELHTFAMKRGKRLAGVSKKKLRYLRLVPTMGKKLSIDAPTSTDSDRNFLDTHASTDHSPETLAAARERLPALEEEIRQIIEDPDAKKPWRDTQMLRWRFGISDGKPRTLKQIGEYYKVSRERVRQIVEKRLSQHGLTEREFRAKMDGLNTIREALGLVPKP